MLKNTSFFSRFRKNKKIKKNTIKEETHKTSEFLDMEKSTKRKSFLILSFAVILYNNRKAELNFSKNGSLLLCWFFILLVL